MALSLGVQVGGAIKIGASVMRILDVSEDGKTVDVSVTKKGIPHLYSIKDTERTEVLEDVFVSCGVTGLWNDALRSKLAFEAPRSIRINRIEPEHV